MTKDPTKKPAKTIATESASNLEEQISCRAYELYQARGGEEGHDVDDWLRAEAELTRKEEEVAGEEVESVAA